MTDSVLPPPPAPIDNRRALVRLGVFVVVGIALAVYLHVLAVLVVISALVAMVMLDQLGHFTMAKLSGMKVTEYFFGFGPKLWSVRRGETEYGVKAIPAGGYVRIIGMTTLEEIDEEDEPRSYRQASFPARIVVGVAGSTVHFLIVLVLLFAVLVGSGYPTPVAGNVISAVPAMTGRTSPAALAGIVPGDRVVGASGQREAIAKVITDIEDHPGGSVPLLVDHDGVTRTVVVHPIARSAAGLAKAGTKTGSQGVIGVDLGGSRNERTSVLRAIPRTGSLFGHVVVASFVGLGQVFSASGLRNFAHQVATASDRSPPATTSPGSSSGNSGQLISIVGAVQVGSQAASQDPSELLDILVAINIFVGIVNLFPMLPLDGGHVVIAIYERMRSRRGRRYYADVRKLMPIVYAFLAFILAIGLGALYANVLHPVTLPGG